MREIVLLAIAIMALQNCFSQKIELENSIVVIKAETGLGNTPKSKPVTLTFILTGTSTTNVTITLKHEQAEIPPCFVDLADKTIIFFPTDFPGISKAVNTVKKTINISTKQTEAFLGDYSIAIRPDADNSMDKDKIIVNSNAAIVHFNTSGAAMFTKRDSSNTIKTDFAFYTDFLGVDNERPNGLYQAELGFKVPLRHTKGLILNNNTDSYFQLFRSLYLNINLLSIDNTLKEDVNNASAIPHTLPDSAKRFGTDTLITTNANGGRDTAFNAIFAKRKLINAFDLYQWASFSAKVKFNVFNFILGNHNIYLAANGGILRTPVYDSLVNKRIHVTSFIYGPELYYETHFNMGDPLFNVRCTLNYYWLKLWNNDLEQVNAPVLKYNTQSRYVNESANSNFAKIFQGSFRIAYIYKEKPGSDGNQIFIRAAYSIQSPTVNTVKFHNGYTQVQFGGLFDLGKILKKIPSTPGDDDKKDNETSTAPSSPKKQ